MASKKVVIEGYTFEKIKSDTYLVTSPNGSQQEKYYLAAENLMKQLQRNKQQTQAISEIYSNVMKEYHKLKAFAEALNAFQDNYTFEVDNCYKDVGNDVVWTTIIANRKKDGASYMFLNPTEQQEILEASYTEFSKLVSTTLSKLKRK